MCTGLEIGLLIAGGALGAGGSIMQSQAQQKNAEARADARNAVLQSFQDKNQRLSEEARAALDARLAQESGMPQDQIAPLQTQRADETRAVLDRASTSAPIQLAGNAPKVVSDEAAKAQADTAEAAGDRSNALARARAFGDLIFNKGLATQEAGNDIGMVNTFARANRRLLPVQQDLAEQSKMGVGRTLGTIGGVTSALGSLASSAGGSGIFGGGSAAPGVSPIPRPRPVNLGL